MKNKLELPSSLDSEMIIIGMMMHSTERNDLACQNLLPKDFSNSKTAIIFEGLQELYSANKSPELPILIQHLKDKGVLTEAGGIPFVVECSDANTFYEDMEEYFDIIVKKSMQREYLFFFQDSSSEIVKGDVDLDEFTTKCILKINSIGRRSGSQNFYSMKELLTGKGTPSGKGIEERLRDLEEQRKNMGDAVCVGLPTGLNDLDKCINGLIKTAMVVIAARPGVGKTSLAVQIAVDVGCRSKMPVAFFSLEMSAEQMEKKMLSNFSGIPLSNLMNGDIGNNLLQLRESAEEMCKAPIYISYAPSPKVSDICREAKKLKDLYDIKLIVIDYLQLVSGGARFKSSESRVNEMSEITKTLKQLAVQLEIPIICLSQLNRGVEGRANKKPVLSDLRDSGSIEQDADVAIFLSRPDMYDKNEKPGYALIDVLKNRYGPLAEVHTSMKLQTGLFIPYVDDRKSAIQEFSNYHNQE